MSDSKETERKLLGCHAPLGCFCDGHCKRTAEEQEAYERREFLYLLGARSPGAHLMAVPADLMRRSKPPEPPIPTEDES